MGLIDFCGLHRICQKILVLARMDTVHPPSTNLPFRKKAQRQPSAPMQTAAFGFILYSIGQSLKILSSSLSIVPALANSSVSA